MSLLHIVSLFILPAFLNGQTTTAPPPLCAQCTPSQITLLSGSIPVTVVGPVNGTGCFKMNLKCVADELYTPFMQLNGNIGGPPPSGNTVIVQLACMNKQWFYLNSYVITKAQCQQALF
ncbi:unnamed protein product, partial [Mesorhabditis belari]|uniref:C6 domain-containing protein n=1 Tax=Mesorhabditis belari TaxID=2138241 RepID=A0AAF3J9F6_9BILA